MLHLGMGKKLQGILILSQQQARGIPGCSDAKEIMKFTKIGHSKFLLKGGNDLLKQCRGGGCKNDVVHIQQQVRNVIARLATEQGGVTSGTTKASREDERLEASIPSVWGLFKSI